MNYIILGGGPSGLAFANRLLQCGENDFLVLEKEDTVGGLCRTVYENGQPFDIGGGHFLDVRRPEVNNFLFGFMPEMEWKKFSRDSRILINGTMIGHPIEANIWQMTIGKQISYLKSIAVAGCNTGVKMPDSFVDWIYWKLGTRIADDYMIPYNKKMFGDEMDSLGTYWLEKLPNVSFRETIISCLRHRAYGTQPGHAQFYYPISYGYGELWSRMGRTLGDRLLCNCEVVGIDFSSNAVLMRDGREFRAKHIITTIPWKELVKLCGMPEELVASVRKLKYTSIQTELFSENLDTVAQWVYCPDIETPYHRLLARSNFVANGYGYWTETNGERVAASKPKGVYRHMNQYAYPLNTTDKPSIMNNLLKWCESRCVYGLGRWGEHQHYNSDATVELAIKLADRLVTNVEYLT